MPAAPVYRLTREVRLNLPTGSSPSGGGTGHAGTPAVDTPALHWHVAVTFSGEPAAASGYLIDIKQVDDAVKARAVTPLAAAVREGTPMPRVVQRLFEAVAAAWPDVTLDAVELWPSPFQSYAVSAKEAQLVRLKHRFEFSAAHRLHNPRLSDAENRTLFGKCNNPEGHGHNYEVQVTLAGRPGADGRLIAVAELERAVEQHAIGKVDHKHLNLQVAEFAETNPSVENIARVIFGWLRAPLARETVTLESVTVWETPKTSCEYSEG